MPDTRNLIDRLNLFAHELRVTWRGSQRSWIDHTRRGCTDEETVVQPLAFPAFAKEFLDWEVPIDLAPEVGAHRGTPDFTPADLITHPFVFETKSTRAGTNPQPERNQLDLYLSTGAIRRVVVTNLVGISVFDRDVSGRYHQTMAIDLRALYSIHPDAAIRLPDAERFAQFVEIFSRKLLSSSQKIERIRTAPTWDQLPTVTDPDWIRQRLQRVVSSLQDAVSQDIVAGYLSDPSRVTETERAAITDELRNLLIRFDVDSEEAMSRTLDDFIGAPRDKPEAGALRQYVAHVAYWLTTKLVLVRIWEDLKLIDPASLYDGGFDSQMKRFDNVISRVVEQAFHVASNRYRALFTQHPTYSWFEPQEDVLASVLYELSNTFLGDVSSDILGQVYEQLLERIDRKLLGQYYTPRDIISLIWDLLLTPELLQEADDSGRSVRVLDIATGSGGFLVEGIARLRRRLESQIAAGADIDVQSWVASVADGFNGVENQRFSCFLSELNVLIQISHLLAKHPALRIPELGIIPADTLSLHNPEGSLLERQAELTHIDLFANSDERLERAKRIKDPEDSGFWMDLAVGNPPYIGERLAAGLLRDTRARHPYWEQFVAPHLDYLYWFLITGISKLRVGGRFGFITTEYWLRAQGAAPLRRFIAERCSIERLLIFRDLRLFPDAPGQHSMIVIGQRLESAAEAASKRHSPSVSVYSGTNRTASSRLPVLEAFKDARTVATLGVRTFTSSTTPGKLGSQPWLDLLLTPRQYERREQLRTLPHAEISIVKGVETTVHRLPIDADQYLLAGTLNHLGFPAQRAGIQLLTSSEVATLGQLNGRERSALRRHINSSDIFPYAAILPTDPDYIIYLSKPSDVPSNLSDEQVIHWPFPPGMPTLETWMRQFEPLLTRKVSERHERRPWWSLHRPRPETIRQSIDSDQAWSPYCITSRWGGGGRITVAMSPADAVPASGLHIIADSDLSYGAAYLTGLLNSTLYQELTDTLPPGQLRSRDIQDLGVILLSDEVRALISRETVQLATLVSNSLPTLMKNFPKLSSTIRNDTALSELPQGWAPTLTAGSPQGTVSSIDWISIGTGTGNQNVPLNDVTVDDTSRLFGRTIVAWHRSPGGDSHALLHLPADASDSLLNAICAWARGLADTGVNLNQIRTQRIPINPDFIVASWREDTQALNDFARKYRSHRSEIDLAILGEGTV